jgi:hypothetical protein
MIGASAVALTTMPAAAAAQDEQAAFAADRALGAALARSDREATGALLDGDFAWTDVDGRTRTRAEALHDLAALAAAHEGDAEVQTHFYGALATVLGVHRQAHFVRIWVKRPAGWRMFVQLETPIPDKPPAQTPVEALARAGDCDNPCRTVPYTPTTPMDKAILASWQETKMEEWHPSPHWPMHIADEFLMINNRSFRTRAQRLVLARQQVETGIGSPGDPIVSMRMHDFGNNAAVMISRHSPYRGGTPYYNVRVWVLREDRWQLALSQQTTIQAADPVPAVTTKK